MLNNCSKFNFTEKCFVAPLATIVHWIAYNLDSVYNFREGYSIRVYFIQSALKLLITNMPNDNFIFVKYMLFKLFENHNERNRHMREYYRFQHQSAVFVYLSIMQYTVLIQNEHLTFPIHNFLFSVLKNIHDN